MLAPSPHFPSASTSYKEVAARDVGFQTPPTWRHLMNVELADSHYAIPAYPLRGFDEVY